MDYKKWYLLSKSVNIAAKNAHDEESRKYASQMLDMQRDEVAFAISKTVDHLRKGIITTEEALRIISDMHEEVHKGAHDVWFPKAERA